MAPARPSLLNNQPPFNGGFCPPSPPLSSACHFPSSSDGTAWWIGFAIGGAFLFFVFLAEYIVVDSGAPYYAISMAGLTAISYTLFFIFAIALRFSGARLLLVIPGFFLATALTSLRILHLRLSGLWEYAWAVGSRLFAYRSRQVCITGPFHQSNSD